MNITLVVSLTIIFLVLWAATEQPHFQVPLSWDDNKEVLIVSDVPPEAESLGIQSGDLLVSMSNTSGKTIKLHRKFLTALPKDRRDHYGDKRSYFEDRRKLYDIAVSDPIVMTFAHGGDISIPRAQGRSAEHLSKAFWLRVATGLLIWICGISVWMWQPGRPELAALGLSSTGLMICAMGQALYADIPNIYSPQFDWWLNFLVNGGLASGGCFVVSLFFYYPVPLRHADRYMRLLIFAIPTAIVMFLLEDWRLNFDVANQALYIDDWEVYGMVIFAYLAGISIPTFQFIKYRQVSNIASQLKWSLFVIVFGPGVYIALRATPSLLGIEPVLSRDASWIVISLVYLFVVVAVARVNLFNLNKHVVTAWRWILLGGIFLVMDLIMVSVFSLNFQAQLFFLFSLALIVYIPMRQKLYQWLSTHTDRQDSNLFTDALRGLLRDSMQDSVSASESWTNMLVKLFKPVSTLSMGDEHRVNCVEKSGNVLLVATNRFSGALCLEYAEQGVRLFSNKDVVLVDELQKIFERLWDYQEAYISGQYSERKRLRRDLHDHVGHKLLSMIHAAPDLTTRSLAEGAMKELGESIRNIQLKASSIEDLGKEICNTFEEICGSTNLKISMTNGLVGDKRILVSDIRRGLLSVVRENLNNIVRHSGADQVCVALMIAEDGNGLKLVIKDNGSGFDVDAIVPGDGLGNIRERMSELGGTASWSFNDGTRVEINLDFVLEEEPRVIKENVVHR